MRISQSLSLKNLAEVQCERRVENGPQNLTISSSAGPVNIYIGSPIRSPTFQYNLLYPDKLFLLS